MSFIRALKETQIQKMADGENGAYCIDKINSKLGVRNVCWVKSNRNITLDEIWNALTAPSDGV